MLVVALSVLLLASAVPSVLSVRQVLQWGQATIRPSGSFVNPDHSISNSFGEPEWLPYDLLEDGEVTDVRPGPFGTSLWRSSAGTWHISNVGYSSNYGYVQNPYYPVKYDWTGTGADPITTDFEVTEMWATPGRFDDFGLPQSLAFHYHYYEKNLNLDDLTVFYPMNVTCSVIACAKIDALNGTVWLSGQLEDRVLGPDYIDENPTDEYDEVPIQWNDGTCGINLPNQVSRVGIGAAHAIAYFPVGAVDKTHPAPNMQPDSIATWGSNVFGQLGVLDQQAKCAYLPTNSTYFLQLPDSSTVISLATGLWHNLVAFDNGVVYSWGDNSRGQLGRGLAPSDVNFIYQPNVITFPTNSSGIQPYITYVAAFGQSSFATDSEGRVYAWGSNAGPYFTRTIANLNWDVGIGALGFGSSRPALAFLDSPEVVPLPVPAGSKLLKVVPPYIANYARSGAATINFLFDVPSPIPATSTPNNPYSKSVSPGDNVIVTWATPTTDGIPGVSNYRQTQAVPPALILELDRNMPLASIGDIQTSASMIYIRNASDDSFWFFGYNDGRLPADGLAAYIHSPYNTANTSEGVTMGSTRATILTAETVIYRNPSASTNHFSSHARTGQDDIEYSTTYLLAADYASSKTIKALRSGATHFVIEYDDNTIETCDASLGSIGSDGWFGRATTTPCGAPTAFDSYGTSIVTSAAGNGVTVAWVCTTSALNECFLATAGNQTLGLSGGLTTGVGNLVNMTGVAALFDTTSNSEVVKSIECGYLFCVVHTASNSLIGWGNIPVLVTDDHTTVYEDPVIIFDSFPVTIMQVSAIGSAVFILGSDGNVYGFGSGYYLSYPSALRHFPVFAARRTVPAANYRKITELSTINGVAFIYSKLMLSSSIGYSPRVGFAAAGTAQSSKRDSASSASSVSSTSNKGTRSTSSDYFMSAWGDNLSFEFMDTSNPPLPGTSRLLGLESPSWLVDTPTEMFTSTSSDLNPAFPFSLNESMEVIASRTQAFAQTSGGEVYYWGESLFYNLHPDAPVYDTVPNGASLLTKGVLKMTPITRGAIFLLENGLVTCNDGGFTCSSSTIDPASGMPIVYQHTSSLTDISCGIYGRCIAIVGNTILQWTGYGLSTPQNIVNVTSIEDCVLHNVWVSCTDVDDFPDLACYHFNYSSTAENGETVTQFGWSSFSAPQTIQPLGLRSSEVSKISAGTLHVLALLTNGSVAGWGDSIGGQLGFYTTDIINSSRILHPNTFGSLPGTTKIIDVSVSGLSSVVLTEFGDVFTWGVTSQPGPKVIAARNEYIAAGLNPVAAPFGNTSSYLTDAKDPANYIDHYRYYDQSTYFNVGEHPFPYVQSHIFPVKIAHHTQIVKLFTSAIGFDDYDVRTFTKAFALSNKNVVRAEAPAAVVPTATPQAVPTPVSGCRPPRPSLATCRMITANIYRWVITQDALLSNNGSKIIISNDVEIEGNLTISVNTSIAIESLGDAKMPTINVTGYVIIEVPIAIGLNDEDLDAISSEDHSTSAAQTILEAESITIQTASGNALSVTSSGKKCKKLSSSTSSSDDSSTGRTTLTSTFTVNSSSCNRWWIILVSVICAVIVLVAIVLIAYFASPKVQRAFRPFKNTNT